MPQQEVYFEERVGERLVAVLKIYDQSYAREVFDNLDDEAKKRLSAALDIESKYDLEEAPDPHEEDYNDFLWDELSAESLEDVRQSPRLYSFFVVTETKEGKAKSIYVSADWPSAEAFAKRRLQGAS